MKKFTVRWQAKFHDSLQSEVFETEQEAIKSMRDLDNNAKKMGFEWTIKPILEIEEDLF